DRTRAAFHLPAPPVTPPEFAALRLVLQPVPLANEDGHWRVTERDETPTVRTTAIIEPFHRLARGSGLPSATREAVTLAGRRLHSDQFANIFGPRRRLQPDHNFDQIRLVAANLFPLARADLTRLAEAIQ